MKSQTAYIIFVLTVLLSCKTSQNQSFIKSKKEKDVALTGAPTPHVLFALESGDTLKFGSRDIYSMLYERIKLQIKSQGYSSDKSWQEIAEIMRTQSKDTLIAQKLSAVDDKTLSGILDTWIARELLLKGKVVVALKEQQADHPTKLKYIYLNDVLGGQQGTFYTEGGKKLYFTIIALGE